MNPRVHPPTPARPPISWPRLRRSSSPPLTKELSVTKAGPEVSRGEQHDTLTKTEKIEGSQLNLLPKRYYKCLLKQQRIRYTAAHVPVPCGNTRDHMSRKGTSQNKCQA